MKDDRRRGTTLEPPHKKKNEEDPAVAAAARRADLETRLSDRHAGVSPQFTELRQGRAGKIRTDVPLEQVAAILNDQLMQLSAADVQSIIDAFPENLRAHARHVFDAVTGFASIESLGELAASLKNETIYRTGPGCLAENLHYVTNRKGLFGDRKINTTTELSSATALLLDHRTLVRFETDPKFAEEIAERKIKLINPRGFVTGLNMFNAVTASEIKEKVGAILFSALSYTEASAQPLSFSGAVRLALDAPIIERIYRSGSTPNLGSKLLPLIEDIEGGDPQTAQSGPTKVLIQLDPSKRGKPVALEVPAEQVRQLFSAPSVIPGVQAEKSADYVRFVSNTVIARKLNGLCGISPEQIEAELNKIPENYRNPAIELIIRNSNVYSHRTIAAEMRKLHAKIEAKASELGVDPAEIYYVVPGEKKSYGMAAMAYCLANGIPTERCVAVDSLPSQSAAMRKSMVVVLDDVAGSGSSLAGSLNAIPSRFKGVSFAAPLIATVRSLRYIGTERLITNNIIGSLDDSSLMAGLHPTAAQILHTLVGGMGFDGNALCTTFVYMSPDNNSGFWAKLMAPYFAVSQTSIKSAYYTVPSAQTVKDLLASGLKSLRSKIACYLGLSAEKTSFPEGVSILRDAEAVLDVAQSVRLPVPDNTRQSTRDLRDHLIEPCVEVCHSAAQTVAGSSRSSLRSLRDSLASLNSVRLLVDLLSREDMPIPPLLLTGADLTTQVQSRAAASLTEHVKRITRKVERDSIDPERAGTLASALASLERYGTETIPGHAACTAVHTLETRLVARTILDAQNARDLALAQLKAGESESPQLLAFSARISALKTMGRMFSSDRFAPHGKALSALHSDERQIKLLLTARQGINAAFESCKLKNQNAEGLGPLFKTLRTTWTSAAEAADKLELSILKLLAPEVGKIRRFGTEYGTQVAAAAPTMDFDEAVSARGRIAVTLIELDLFSATSGLKFQQLKSDLTEADRLLGETVATETKRLIASTSKFGTEKSLASLGKLLAMRTNGVLSPELRPKLDSLVLATVTAARDKAAAELRNLFGGIGEQRLFAKAQAFARSCSAVLELYPFDTIEVRKLLQNLESIAEPVERYVASRTTVLAKSVSITRLQEIERLMTATLPTLSRMSGVSEILGQTISSERAALGHELFKTLQPFIAQGFGTEQERLWVYARLSGYMGLLEGAERAAVAQELQAPDRYSGLIANFFGSKAEELRGATLNGSELIEQAQQIAAALTLSSGLRKEDFIAEEVITLSAFAHAAVRAAEEQPDVIDERLIEAMKPLFALNQSEGFFDVMSHLGFNRAGELSESNVTLYKLSEEDDIGRIAKYAPKFQAVQGQSKIELRSKAGMLLVEITAFLSTSSSTAAAQISQTVVDSLRLRDGITSAALSQYLSKYSSKGSSATEPDSKKS